MDQKPDEIVSFLKFTIKILPSEEEVDILAEKFEVYEFEDPHGNKHFMEIEKVNGYPFAYELISVRGGWILEMYDFEGEKHSIKIMSDGDSLSVWPIEDKGFHYLRKRRWEFPENVIGVAKEIARAYFHVLRMNSESR